MCKASTGLPSRSADQLQVDGLAVVVGEDRGQVGVRDRRAKQERGAERVVGCLVALLDRPEAHDDVGEGTLRPDVGGRVRLAAFEVRQDLVALVAVLGRSRA